MYPESGRHLPSSAVTQPIVNTCACLSEQYLLLEQLRLKTQLVVPDDLHMLRGTIQKAIDVLNCQHCPLRYFSILPNSVIMGTVCLCIGECYARILDNINLEVTSLKRNGEHKRVRISNCDDDIPHYASPLFDSSLFSVNLVPTEWRRIMRSVVKAEIFGQTENNIVHFMKLVSSS